MSAVCGAWRHMNASMSTSPRRSASFQAVSASSGLRVYGFSQSTCLPAASARIVHSWWSAFGSAITTASSSGSPRSASYESWTRSMPCS